MGAEAGKRAAGRVGPRKLTSRTAAVMFEDTVSTSILGPLISAISGPSVARGTSFLKDKLGKPVFAKGITIRDDPFRKRGLGSASFDDEGVAVQVRDLIEDGVLTTWLLNSSSARQLGLETTGNASRGLAGAPGVSTHNPTLHAGSESPKALMAAASEGLLVTSMFGPSLNANTGDWSAGVSGFWWENGEPAYPVNEITVAGNLLDIYARLVPANDLEIHGGGERPLDLHRQAGHRRAVSDLALLIDAAKAAGDLMLQRRGHVTAERKPDGSPVTDADLAVDALLHGALTGARPTYGWLSEETPDDLARLNAWRVFIIDPIDGTTAYLDGDPWFAVSLAVVENGRPIAGVVFAPELDQLYAAQAGQGATLNGAPIRPSPTTALEGATFLGNPSNRRSAGWEGITVNRCNALALRMARVAAGENDAAISATPKNEWDLAAGVVICQEAGAVACDKTGQPLRFNTPAAKTPGLVCCTPALLPLILAKTAATPP